jgi:uncharacterized protein HemY
MRAAGEVLAKAEMTASKRRIYLPDVLRTRGLLFARKNQWHEAENAFNQAVQEAHSMPYPYSEARALYEHSMMHVQKVEPLQARAKLEHALAVFRRLGARPYIERTEQALVQLGVGISSHAAREE